MAIVRDEGHVPYPGIIHEWHKAQIPRYLSHLRVWHCWCGHCPYWVLGIKLYSLSKKGTWESHDIYWIEYKYINSLYSKNKLNCRYVYSSVMLEV